MMYIFVMILTISLLLFFFSYFISKKKMDDFEKLSPFECGFNMFDSPRSPFSLRFFLLSIIFLVFDIEIVLLMPYMINFYLCHSLLWSIMLFFFIGILIWGLVYEWFLGSLNWF